MVSITPAFSNEDIMRSIAIRREVFVIGQNVDEKIEVDEMDQMGSGCMHFLITLDEKDIGTFRVIPLADGSAKLQRFCVIEEMRGKGYGRYALEFLEGFIESMGVNKIVLDSQCAVIGFYEKSGYKVMSEEFEEAGIMHVKMEKGLL